MKNHRGQALVEFILIIPVFAFLILGIMDIGNIVISKYNLENDLSNIVEMYQNDKYSDIDKYAQKNNIKVSYEKDDSYTTIILVDNLIIKTPGLNNVLGKKMKIETKRVIYNEQ